MEKDIKKRSPRADMTTFNPALAILINPNAKQVNAEVISNFERFSRKQHVPVRVYKSTTLEELEDIIRKEVVEKRVALVGAVGGDGSLYQTWNKTHKLASQAGQATPPFVLFGCGTGNALAGLVGSEKYPRVLDRLKEQLKKEDDFSRIPLEKFTMIRMQGERSDGERCGPYYFSFAGCGLDAEILNRYNRLKSEHNRFWQRKLYSEGWRGYLLAGLRTGFARWSTESFPLALKVNANSYDRIDPEEKSKRIEVPVNPGEDILKGEKEVHGVILGTTPMYGFGFNAFPYASWANDCNGGKFHVRILVGPREDLVVDFLANLFDYTRPFHFWRRGTSLWNGNYFSRHLQEYFLDDFVIKGKIPAQIAGEAMGFFDEIHYRKASEQLQLYNSKPHPWRFREKKEKS